MTDLTKAPLTDWGRRVLQEIADQPDGMRRYDPWNWSLQQLHGAGLIDKKDADSFAAYRYRVTPAGRRALSEGDAS